MKKFLTFVLVLAMVLSVSSVALAMTKSEFLDLADSSGVIELTGPAELSESVVVENGKTITIDLKGQTISASTGFSGDSMFVILYGGELIINDTVGGGKIDASNVQVGIKMGDAAENHSPLENTHKMKLTVNDGTIEGQSFGISGNGYRHNTEIIINDGTIEGGSTAIYHPQMGTLTVKGGTIEGAKTGIEMRGGTLEITGGTIIGNGTPFDSNPNNNGTTTEGAAIAVSQHSYDSNQNVGTDPAISVTIAGGKMQGELALYQHDFTADLDADPVTMSVTGGEFIGKVVSDTDNLPGNSKVKDFISGGKFSVAPDADLIADNMAAANVGNGTTAAPFTIEAAKTSGTSGDTITIVPASLDFGTVKAGYAQPEAKMISVQGVGTSDKYVTVTVSAGYEVSSAKDSGYADSVKLDVDSSAPSDFKVYVRPQANLGAGTYNGSATVQVNNSSDIPKLNKDNEVALTFVVEPNSSQTVEKPSGNGISVKYNGGNSFSTSNPSVPTGVEIDGVPVTFNGTGSNFSVGCISSDAKWVTVRWNSTSVTTNFAPDGLVECTNVSIPKTGGMSIWAAIAQFLGF